MKTNKRFIAAIIRAAKRESAPLPWSRKRQRAPDSGRLRKLG